MDSAIIDHHERARRKGKALSSPLPVRQKGLIARVVGSLLQAKFFDVTSE
jgi:hypothetical protein